MIKENILLLLCTAVLARPEPPVNQYLPPSQNGGQVNGDYSPQNANNFGQQNGPSTSYGPPSAGLAGNPINNNGQLSDSYSGGRNGGGVNQTPSQTYGPPNQSFAPGNNQNDGQNFPNTPNGNRSPNQESQTPRDLYGPPNSNSVNGNKNQQGSSRGSTTFNGNRGNQGTLTDSYQTPNGNNSPKSSYGPPSIESGSPIGTTGQQQQQSSFGAPSNQLNQRGQFGSQSGNGPQTSYGAPDGFGKMSSQGFDNNQRPSDSYGPPPLASNSNQINGRTGSSDSYAPSVGQGNNVPQGSYGPPSASQQKHFGGATGFDNASNRNNEQSASGYPSGSNNGIQNSEQGYPSGGPSNSQNSQGYNSFGNNQQGLAGSINGQGNSRVGGGSSNRGNEGSNEPAKYEFKYEVEDEPSGLMFGHSEKRDGDLTTGQYNVLLPDGRKQIVQYEADANGYRPQIRYEGEANTNGGQNGRQGGTNGYSNNGRPQQGQGYPSVPSAAQGLFSNAGASGPAAQGGYSNAGTNPSNYAGNSPDGSYPSNQSGYPSGKPATSNQLGSPNSIGPGNSQGNYPNAQSPTQGNYPNALGTPGRNDFSGAVSTQNQNGEGYPRGGPSSQNQNGYDSNRNDNSNGYSSSAGAGQTGFDPIANSQGVPNGQFSSPTAQNDNTNGYPSGIPQIPFGGNSDSSSNYPDSGKLGPDATGYQGRPTSQNPNGNGFGNSQLPNESSLIGGSNGYPSGGPTVRGSGY